MAIATTTGNRIENSPSPSYLSPPSLTVFASSLAAAMSASSLAAAAAASTLPTGAAADAEASAAAEEDILREFFFFLFFFFFLLMLSLASAIEKRPRAMGRSAAAGDSALFSLLEMGAHEREQREEKSGKIAKSKGKKKTFSLSLSSFSSSSTSPPSFVRCFLSLSPVQGNKKNDPPPGQRRVPGRRRWVPGLAPAGRGRWRGKEEKKEARKTRETLDERGERALPSAGRVAVFRRREKKEGGKREPGVLALVAPRRARFPCTFRPPRAEAPRL